MTDPKTLWREQALEGSHVGLASLQASVRAQVDRIRRGRILLVLGALAGIAIAVQQAILARTELVRLGEGLLAAGFVAQLALGWRRLSQASPEPTETCVAFLRRSLVLRRDAALGGWITLIAPLLPGLWVTFIGLAAASGSQWQRLMPIAALMIVWLALMLLLLAREAATVAAEIAHLDRQDQTGR